MRAPSAAGEPALSDPPPSCPEGAVAARSPQWRPLGALWWFGETPDVGNGGQPYRDDITGPPNGHGKEHGP